MIATELITDLSALEPLETEWDELAAVAQLPMMSPACVLAWWAHLAPATSLPRVVVARENGRLVGLAPFYVDPAARRGRLDLRLPGIELAGRLAPLASAGRETEVADATARVLADSGPSADILALEGLPASMSWASALRAGWPGRMRPLSSSYSVHSCPIVSLQDESYSAWLASKSSNFRSQMRRLGRQFAAAGGTTRSSTADTLAADVDVFMDLHASRWEGRGESHLLTERDAIAATLVQIGLRLVGSQRFRLRLLEIGGKPISAQLFLAAGGRVLYVNGGWDERFAHLKPSMVGILGMVEEAFERGELVPGSRSRRPALQGAFRRSRRAGDVDGHAAAQGAASVDVRSCTANDHRDCSATHSQAQRVRRSAPALQTDTRPDASRTADHMNRDRLEQRPWPHVIVLDPFTAGLAVARRMMRLGARVTMLLEPSDPWAARSRHVETVIAPFADGQAWLRELRRIATCEDQAVVLPATDRSCELLLRSSELLPDNLLAFERSGHAHLALMDKGQADGIARSAGVAVPWTARVDSIDELETVAAGAPWPCVVKPVFSHEWRERYGQARVFIASDEREASGLLSRPLQDGVGMLLCQYVPGGDDDVEEAIVVRLADGSYPVSFGCRKLRQNPPGFGATALGEALPLPETTAIARRVLDQAGFVGVAGVETKRDAQTGERWFLEVNVRIPGQWGLGDTCGVQATTRLVDTLTGRPMGPQPPLRRGVRIVVPDADAPVVWQALKATPPKKRPSFLFRIALSYRQTRNFGLLDLRDPGPGLNFVAMLARRRLAGLIAGARRLAGH